MRSINNSYFLLQKNIQQSRVLTAIVFLLIIATATGLITRNTPTAHAAATYSYSGCFERENTGTSATLWMQAPRCTIHFTNSEATTFSYPFTILNLDPQQYIVTNSSGEQISVTRNETSLSFYATIAAQTTETLTITPWDYDPNATDFWFGAISDPQSQPGGDKPNPIFVKIMNQMEVFHPRFVTASGDMIGGDEEDPAEHELEYELYDLVYQGFEGTTMAVPGDHDAKQSISDYYEHFYGPDYYTFTYGNTRFIGLDDSETLESEGTISDEQMAWLETTLAAATEEHIIVFMQHPIIPPTWSNSQGIDEEYRLPIAQLFTQYDVELVLCGDAHGYDDMMINSDVLPGLTGSYRQVDVAGAGGKYNTYDGDHFFVMVHVSDDIIEHYKFDYSDVDVTTDYTSLNDGSETEVSFTATNKSAVAIPYIRAKFNVQASKKLYAMTTAGDFLPVTSADIDGVRRGYVTLSLNPGESLGIIVKERTKILTNTKNIVDTDGLITFPNLPTATSQETELKVQSAKYTSTIEILNWDAMAENRQWHETTVQGARTNFTISGMIPDREYIVYVGDTPRYRVASDEEGMLTFSHREHAAIRQYHLKRLDQQPIKNIAVLPASRGGAQVRIFNKKGEVTDSFFAYDTDLNHGFHSLWADIDGDDVLELITVPETGAIGHVRAFEENGETLAGVFPFGKAFTGGVNMMAADVDNDGIDELIVSPQAKKNPEVRVYRYQASAKKFTLIDLFEVFDKHYIGGVNIAVGNIDGVRGEEIVVGARSEKPVIAVYRWSEKTLQMEEWLRKRAYDPINTDYYTGGFSLATGDMNFDGRDEVIIGSWSGGSLIRAFAYQPKKQRLHLANEQQAFEDTFSGGVYVTTGNVNTTPQEEIIVSPRSTHAEESRIRIFTKPTQKKKMRMIADTAPVTGYTGGLHISVVDPNGDWKQELAVTQDTGSSYIFVYAKRKIGLKNTATYLAYDRAFTGGLTLAQ
ncbi:MAG: metallophosphoesterase [Candidatus Kerfeldbacteria bacterium]|nr:metallophosphoesterase [Candidatus Kerfeldbacteria bacterium]